MSQGDLFPENSNVLFTVLNWGLGHASRSVPLIQRALDKGCKVYIASDGIALQMLEAQFKGCTFLQLPAYDIRYKYESVFLNILIQSPRFLGTYLRENKKVSEYVRRYNIDLIVSDNRFGCHSTKCKAVYLSHQLTILHSIRWIGYIATFIHSMIMKKFDEIWVPDNSGSDTLSGKLGRPLFRWLKNIRYIGPLSRLQQVKKVNEGYTVLVLLSGPEPQRTYLESKLAEVLVPVKDSVLFIRGTNVLPRENLKKTYHHTDLANTREAEQAISDASWIICRSGYSTIMDLNMFDQKNVIFIPTPGQTEQEYLGQYHQQKSTSVHLVEQSKIGRELLKLIESGI